MALKSKRKEQDDPKLDMTPMIDVVFQLMIFFVVTLKQEDIYSMLLANAPAPNNGKADETAPQPVKIDLGPVHASDKKYAHMTFGSAEVGATREVDPRDLVREQFQDAGLMREKYVRDGDLLVLKPGLEAKYAAYCAKRGLPQGRVDDDAIMFHATRGLRDKLKNVDKDQIIVVSCANGAPHSLLLDVLNTCTRLGLRNVNVMSFNNNVSPQ